LFILFSTSHKHKANKQIKLPSQSTIESLIPFSLRIELKLLQFILMANIKEKCVNSWKYKYFIRHPNGKALKCRGTLSCHFSHFMAGKEMEINKERASRTKVEGCGCHLMSLGRNHQA